MSYAIIYYSLLVDGELLVYLINFDETLTWLFGMNGWYEGIIDKCVYYILVNTF